MVIGLMPLDRESASYHVGVWASQQSGTEDNGHQVDCQYHSLHYPTQYRELVINHSHVARPQGEVHYQYSRSQHAPTTPPLITQHGEFSKPHSQHST